MNKINTNRNSGFTMALVLMVILLMLLLGTSLLSLSKNTRIASIRRSQEIAAKCAADAGLTMAISRLAVSYEQGTLDLANLPSEPAINIENSEGSFRYVVYLGAMGEITIDSTGLSGPCQRTVHCNVDVQSGRFEHALFADSFIISNNAFIDGYNSDYGPYGGANVIITSIGTNNTADGAIKLDMVGDLKGDIIVGPGADPANVIDMGTHFEITGETSAAEEEKTIPILSPSSTLTHKGSTLQGTITESGTYDQINSTNGEAITIEGDVTINVTGDVRLDNNSMIVINPGSSLTLFIEGTFEMSNGGGINNLTQKPPKCKIFSTATTQVLYDFNNTGTFYGALYAPNANVQVSNNAIIYGAIVANTLNIDNSSEIYGDEALTKGIFNDDDTSLTRGKWWE
jgi:hypothetical protein